MEMEGGFVERESCEENGKEREKEEDGIWGFSFEEKVGIFRVK